MFLLLLSAIMLPNQVTLFSVCVLKLKWVDTLKPLIIPSFLGTV